jgi:Rrf2 family transcriptional regulator, nitric oxide-sensitive transcriptional repressor
MQWHTAPGLPLIQIKARRPAMPQMSRTQDRPEGEPMRLTVRTNLALRTLMVCATNPERIVRKAEAARAINASENHLAQVVNQLGQTGFLTTLRGRGGGFTLGRPAAQISVGDVFRTFEADLPFIECLSDDNTCPLRGACRMQRHLVRAVESFYATLDPLTLADLVECNGALDQLLSLSAATARPACQPARLSGQITVPA